MPFYIVSGGVNVLINSILESVVDILKYENFFLFSNRMIFNDKGVLVDLEMKVSGTTKMN